MRPTLLKQIMFVASIGVLALSHSASSEDGQEIPAKGYAAMEAKGHFARINFTRPALKDKDVLVEILYSGICHSDIHSVNEDWMPGVYPMIPGHEIIGKVAAVGKGVSKVKIGDTVGVGGLVDSCGECEFCRIGKEQYCPTVSFTGTDAPGGYSNNIVSNERFAFRIPDGMPLDKIAPLMCAGITTFSPLHTLGVKGRDQVAVAGLGGLGHLAVKWAKAMGAEVTVFEITDAKEESARALGASQYANTRKNPEALAEYQMRFDMVISTIPAAWEIQPYVDSLKQMGTLVILGIPPMDQSTSPLNTNMISLFGRRIMGSQVGGIPETQEMLRFAAEHGIYPDVEVIPVSKIDESFQRVLNGDVRYRFVIDMKSLD